MQPLDSSSVLQKLREQGSQLMQILYSIMQGQYMERWCPLALRKGRASVFDALGFVQFMHSSFSSDFSCLLPSHPSSFTAINSVSSAPLKCKQKTVSLDSPISLAFDKSSLTYLRDNLHSLFTHGEACQTFGLLKCKTDVLISAESSSLNHIIRLS